MKKSLVPRYSVSGYLKTLREVGLYETHDMLVYPLRVRNVGEAAANKNVSDLWFNIVTKFNVSSRT